MHSLIIVMISNINILFHCQVANSKSLLLAISSWANTGMRMLAIHRVCKSQHGCNL